MADTVRAVHAQRQELLDARYDPAGELGRREHTLRQAAHSLHPPVEYLRLLPRILEALRAATEDEQARDTLLPEPGGDFGNLHTNLQVLILLLVDALHRAIHVVPARQDHDILGVGDVR